MPDNSMHNSNIFVNEAIKLKEFLMSQNIEVDISLCQKALVHSLKATSGGQSFFLSEINSYLSNQMSFFKDSLFCLISSLFLKEEIKSSSAINFNSSQRDASLAFSEILITVNHDFETFVTLALCFEVRALASGQLEITPSLKMSIKREGVGLEDLNGVRRDSLNSEVVQQGDSFIIKEAENWKSDVLSFMTNLNLEDLFTQLNYPYSREYLIEWFSTTRLQGASEEDLQFNISDYWT